MEKDFLVCVYIQTPLRSEDILRLLLNFTINQPCRNKNTVSTLLVITPQFTAFIKLAQLIQNILSVD